MYAAPEIYKKADYDPYKADIWALGVLLYRFFTFNYPYKANDMKMLSKVIKEGNPNYQPLSQIPSIKNIIQKMFILKPQLRISIHEAILQLEKGMNHSSILRINSLPDKITLKLKKSSIAQKNRRLSSGMQCKSFVIQQPQINKSLSRGSPLVIWQTF